MRATRFHTVDEENRDQRTRDGQWTDKACTSTTTHRTKSSRNSSDGKLGSLIEYPDYVRLRKNGSIKHDRDLNNSFYTNTSMDSRLEVHNSHHNEHSQGVTKQNGSPPGTVFNFYKQFNDYWNVFPKTDFTYSPTSMYYGKEIAPGIPIIPNLSRRALYKTSSNGHSYNDYSFNVAPSQIRHLKHLRHVRQSTWEKVVTVITTVVTTTITTVMTTVSVVTEPLVHPTKSPRKTFFFLLALLLLPLLYYLYLCDLEQNENESLVNRLNRLNFINRSVFSQALEILKRPVLWLYWLFGELITLIINTITMVPAFVSQSYYATSAYLFAIFKNHTHTTPVMTQSVGKVSDFNHGVKIDAQEIRKIVEEVLAEKQESRTTEIAVNDMKEIVKEIVLEHEEKTKQENFDTVVAKAHQIITPLLSKQENSIESFMKGINEHVGNIEKSLEEQKEDINRFKPQIKHLEEKVMTQMTQPSELRSIDSINESTALAGSVVKQELVELVESALYKYHADRTGKTDYALMSNGGVIISIRCTQTYRKTQGVMTLFGFSFWDVYNTPETIIKPGMMPGECWAFEGSEGYVVIKLAIPIYVTAVTMEHTPKELTHHGHIKSAPKQFSVWTLKDVKDENPEFLGRFKFQDTKGSLQTFDTKPTSVPSDLVELRIESNHGHLEYTCLYRFRVHGIPAT